MIIKWAIPGLFFVYFRPFQTILQNKNCRLSGIRAWTVGVGGEHSGHMTTTMAHKQVKPFTSLFFTQSIGQR